MNLSDDTIYELTSIQRHIASIVRKPNYGYTQLSRIKAVDVPTLLKTLESDLDFIASEADRALAILKGDSE